MNEDWEESGPYRWNRDHLEVSDDGLKIYVTVATGGPLRFSRLEVEETSDLVRIAAFLKVPRGQMQEMQKGPVNIRPGPAIMHRASVELVTPLGDRRVMDASETYY